MKSKTKKKITAFILALVLLASASSVGYFLTNAQNGDWAYDESADTEIFIENWSGFLGQNESDKIYQAITEQAKIFSYELAEKLGRSNFNISMGTIDHAGNRDIVLRYGEAQEISEQGYSVFKEGDRLVVAASDLDGLFYGCRYVIKQILIDADNKVTAVTDDHPDVKERALSIDIGRKYFTVDWIKNMIKEISWLNMNTLIVHFSEDMGLGLESKRYPWLNGGEDCLNSRDPDLCPNKDIADKSRVDLRALKQSEMADIIQFAKKYHVNIVPSFDTPGHMNYIVKKFNEKCKNEPINIVFNNEKDNITAPQGTDIGNYYFIDKNNNGAYDEGVDIKTVVPGSGDNIAKTFSRGIDISNECAVAFTRSLLEEYADFFSAQGCTAFDIGGDELLGYGDKPSSVARWQSLDHWKYYANERAVHGRWSNIDNLVAYDAFIAYMNDLWDMINYIKNTREDGFKSVRMWNDDALRTHDTGWNGAHGLNTDIEIEFWTYSAANQTIFTRYANLGYSMYNYLCTYNYYVLGEGIMQSKQYENVSAQNIFTRWNPYVFNSEKSALGYVNNNSYIGDPHVKGSGFLIWCDDPTYKTEAEVKEITMPLIRANAAKSWSSLLNEEISYNIFSANMQAIGGCPSVDISDIDKEIYTTPPVDRLRFAAFDDYERMCHHRDEYASAQFAAYEAAVNAGREILARYDNGEKPTYEEVDNAIEAIRAAMKALEHHYETDKKAIQAEIAAFDSVDKTLYSAESYSKYKNSVKSAKNLIAKGDYRQRDLNNALSTIVCAKMNLTPPEGDANNCVESVKVKTHDINHDFIAIVGVKFKEGTDYNNFTYKIFADEDPNTPREIVDTVINEKKGVVYLYFKPLSHAGVTVDVVEVYSGNELVGKCAFTVEIV